MSIIYSIETSPNAVVVQALFKQTDWADDRTIEDIQIVLDKSINVCAWDGEKLVGFARAVSDGRFRAFVEDVVVDEAYRKQGIGAGVMRKLLRELEHIDVLNLQCEDYNVGFYEKFGFKPTNSSAMYKSQN